MFIMRHPYNTFNKYLPYLLLLIITVIGYWQVALREYCLKYDMIDYFYPYRYYIGECLRNHILPLWNPYHDLGSPVHADPQSGAWYPLVWIIGYFYGYDIHSLGFEFILHIFLAGIGMYHLGKRFGFQNNVAFIMAISYIFSGFFIGNAQHFSWIISGAWIPFILYSYIDTYNDSSYRSAIKTGFFMYLLIAGGYPAFTFILGYLLLFLFLFYTVIHFRKKETKRLLLFIKLNFVTLITTLLLCMAIIVSVYNAIPYNSRSGSINLEDTLFSPLSPQALISFLLPFAVIKDMIFYDTDLSMSNIYFGLIAFVFFIVSLFIKKPKIMILFLLFGLFALTASMGKYLPVRTFLYDHIPLMNLFRFPSIFRLFVLLSFIILSGYSLNYFRDKQDVLKKYLKITSITLVIILSVFFNYVLLKGNIGFLAFLKNDLFVSSQNSTLYQHIAFQSLIQIFILLIFIYLISKNYSWEKLIRYITILLVCEIVLSAQLNEPYTVYSEIFKTKPLKEHSMIFPESFPLPPNKNVIDVSQSGLNYGPLWLNLHIFHKQIGVGSYSPFTLKSYQYLKDSLPGLFKATLTNPLMFLSDKVFVNDSIGEHNKHLLFHNKNIYLNQKDFATTKGISFKHSPEDTVIITKFSPVKIVAQVKCSNDQVITLLQNNYPGWKVFVNNKETPVLTSNLCFISAIVPKGENIIEFHYRSSSVIIAFYISLISLIATLFIFFKFRKNYFSNKEFQKNALSAKELRKRH